MSYVDKNLSPDEKIRCRAKVHWVIYIPPLLLFIISLPLLFSEVVGLGMLLLAISLFVIVSKFIYAKTTELALTNKRVIAKIGLVRRSTIEQRLEMIDNVASIKVF